MPEIPAVTLKSDRNVQEEVTFFEGVNSVVIDYNHCFLPIAIWGDIEAITGYKEIDLVDGTLKWGHLVHTDDRDLLWSRIEEFQIDPKSRSGFRNYRIITKNGEEKSLGELLQRCDDGKEGKVCFKGLLFDLPVDSLGSWSEPLGNDDIFGKQMEVLEIETKKRKRAEYEFLREKEFFEKTLDAFSYPFFVIDAETYEIKLSNRYAREFFGGKEGKCYHVTHRRDTPCDKDCKCPLKVVRETKKLCVTEHVHYDKQGKPRYFEVHGFPIVNEQGEVYQIIEYSFEVTEKRLAEIQLKESEEKYRLLFQNERDAIMLLDAESHRIIDANEASVKLYQFDKETLLGMKATELSAEPEETAEAMNKGELGESTEIRLRWHKKKDGKVFPVEISAAFFEWKGKRSLSVIIREISERKEREEQQARMEKRLATTQKMNAIGTLAGGIAHDFNNLLFAQIGYLEMALSKMDQENVCHDYIKESLSASMRATDLVKQILTFSRSDHVSTEPISLAPILKETVKMLTSSIPRNIKIRTDIDTNTHKVIGNPVQIQQMILNICSNAEHAMKEKGGELFVELSDQQLPKIMAENLGFDRPGTYVALLISDTGEGMTPDVKEKIFEPYFTTKPYWQGSGMGLAVVHSIVQNNMEGVISVDSQPGIGSQFKMVFPALIEGLETPKTAFTGKREKVLKSQVVILLVDDDEMVCSMGETILSNQGYYVITQTDPMDAIDLYKKEASSIDLVVIDQVMPGMTGIQLAREMSDVKKDFEAILLTAEKVNLGEEKLKAIGIVKTVSKPISKHSLTAAIGEVLKSKSMDKRQGSDYSMKPKPENEN